MPAISLLPPPSSILDLIRSPFPLTTVFLSRKLLAPPMKGLATYRSLTRNSASVRAILNFQTALHPPVPRSPGTIARTPAKTTRLVEFTVMLLLNLFGLQISQAQSGGAPGSQVMVALAGSGVTSGVITYNDGSGRVDIVTNQIIVRMQVHPYSPQPNGGVFSSTLADFVR